MSLILNINKYFKFFIHVCLQNSSGWLKIYIKEKKESLKVK